MRKILIVLMGLACGAVTAQGPEFIQQYTQRLGGWRDAYALQLSELEQRAAKFGLPREDYVVALQNSDDPKARNEGNHLAKVPAFYETLKEAYEKLSAAGPLGRAFVFMDYYNGALASQVWAGYRPGLPANTEGAIYGGAGFVVGAMGLFLLGLPFRFVSGLRSRRRPRALDNLAGGTVTPRRSGSIVSRITGPIGRLRQRFSKKPAAD